MSFVVPALNEEANIDRTVKQILAVAGKRFSDFEVILVDDGSTDATGSIMDSLAKKQPRLRVLHNERNLGLGASYRRGVDVARCEYLMGVWGDNPMPAESLDSVLREVGKKDIVVPYPTNFKQIKSPSRYIASRTYTNLINKSLGLQLHYYNGLAIHRLSLLRSITITDEGFGFQAEILVKLLKAGCAYVEVGVPFAAGGGKSRAVQVKTLWRVAKLLARLLRLR